MSRTRRLMQTKRRAFTLLEMMLVVVIIGLLVGVAVMNLTGQSTIARQTATEATLRTYKNAIDGYFMRTGAYPATLQVLVPADLPKLSNDAWKNALVYYPGVAGAPNPYTLFSMGADGQAATQDDINVWTIGE